MWRGSSIRAGITRLLANRELLLTGLANITQFISGILFLKIISVAVSDTEYGRYMLAFSLVNLISLFPFAALDTGVARFLALYQKQGHFPKKFSQVFLGYGAILVAYAVIFLPLWFGTRNGPHTALADNLPVIFLSAVTAILSMALLNVENFRRNRFRVMMIRAWESLGKIGALLLLMGRFTLSAGLLLLLTAFVQAGSILFLVWRNRADFALRACEWADTKRTFREIMAFAAPLVLWGVANWVQTMAPFWLLNVFAETRLVGHLTMLNNIAGIIPAQLAAILSGYLSPILYEMDLEDRDAGNRLLKKYLLAISVTLGVITLFSIPLGPILIRIVSSTHYLEFVWMLPVLFLLGGIRGIAQVSTLETFVRRETWRLLPPYLIASVVTLPLCLILIPLYGMPGALGGMVISTVLLTVLILRITLRR